MSTVTVNSSTVKIDSSALEIDGGSGGGGDPWTPTTNSLTNFSVNAPFEIISPQTVGVTSTWSVAGWAKLASAGAGGIMSILSFNDTTLYHKNGVTLAIYKPSIMVGYTEVRDGTIDAGAHRQLYYYASAGGYADPRVWRHYVMTWNGAVSGLVLYQDGVVRTATTTVYNNDDTGISNPENSRDIYVGNSGGSQHFHGHLYSASIYDTVLDQTNVTALYNAGDGVNFNVLANSGGYTASANCITHYQLGKGTTAAEFGQDRGQNATLHLTSAGFDASDLSADVPGP